MQKKDDHTIAKIDIKKLSKLAGLELSVEEEKALVEHLTELQQMFNRINQVNTDNVSPLQFIHETYLSGREDEIKASILRDRILNLSPTYQDSQDYYLVPRFLPTGDRKKNER